jgi:NarL family two-component system response regulator LiaR
MPNLTTLTHREVEIVQLIAGGKRNSEIATVLHITIHTVETHLRNIYSKLEIRTRTEAARWYWQHDQSPYVLHRS